VGQYFVIVNPAKRQYIDAFYFGENIKASGYMLGLHAVAVAVLVCNSTQVRYELGINRPEHDYGPLAGAWFGDAVYAAGDDNGPPDEFGIETATPDNPERNLSRLAKEEYEDISYAAMAMLCQGQEEYARQMAEQAATSYSGALIWREHWRRCLGRTGPSSTIGHARSATDEMRGQTTRHDP
jgi:hypothetical protein